MAFRDRNLPFPRDMFSPRGHRDFERELGNKRSEIRKGDLGNNIQIWLGKLKGVDMQGKMEAVEGLGLAFSDRGTGFEGLREEVASELRKSLGASNEDLRRQVIRALALMHDEKSADEIKNRVTEAAQGRESEENTENAVIALGFMGKKGIRALEDLNGDADIERRVKIKKLVIEAIAANRLANMG